MKIRKATIEDIPQIVALWREVADMHAKLNPMFELIEAPENKYLDHIKDVLVKENSYVVVAETNDTIAGYAIIALGKRPDVFVMRNSGTIQDVYVKPEYRNAGTGKKMIKALVDFAKEKDTEIINLTVAIDNKEGNKFWIQMGFRPTLNFMSLSLV
jgi:ribosomal protein S18 acetylase RimI-like enzyme